MIKVPFWFMFVFLLSSFIAYAVPKNAPSAIAEATSENRFLFLTFYETDDASLAAMLTTIINFKQSTPVKCTNYNAKMSDPKNKEIADKFGIRAADLPIVLAIAPTGAITGGYPKNVTGDQLNQSVNVTELMQKVLKSMQDQKVTLVALQNQSTMLNAESWQGVSDFVNDANYSKLAASVKADPAAPGSRDFMKQCQLISPLTQATVVVLMPPGKIGKILSGKVTKDDILKALASCASGCAPGACSDRRFKEDIAPITSALDKVTKLQGVAFTWNRDAFPNRFFPEGTEVGLIAQDVEMVIPEVVLTDKEGFKSVKYDKLTAVLIEAVKEMKQKINSQDSVITAQNARIKKLEGAQ